MFCNKCGSEIPDDSEFCPECGRADEEKTDAANPAGEAKGEVPVETKPAAEAEGANNVASERPVAVAVPVDSASAKPANTASGSFMIAAIAAVVTVVVFMAIFFVSCAGTVPQNAYDVTKVMTISPVDVSKWMEENDFQQADDSKMVFYRTIVDGEIEPGMTRPSGEWELASQEGYVLLNSPRESAAFGKGKLQNLFTSEAADEPSFGASEPRLVMFNVQKKANSDEAPEESTEEFLKDMLAKAGLKGQGTTEQGNMLITIGSCKIGNDDGIWMAMADVEDYGSIGYIVCGYADEFKKALGINAPTVAELERALY